MADLTWKVSEIKYNCNSVGNNWVRVEPSTGRGSTENVTVYVTTATSPNACTSATITISASTGDFQKIPVTRCVPECSCQSLGYSVESGLDNLSHEGGTKKVASFTPNTACGANGGVMTDGIVLSNPTSGADGSIYAVVSPNNSGARTGWLRLLYEGEICVEKTVIQAASPQTRWVKDGTMCEGVAKYNKEKEQKSEDGGTTWTDTGNTRKGDLIEACSDDCGCSPECHYEIEGGGESDGCEDKNITFTATKHEE